jgi:hypothetical protein
MGQKLHWRNGETSSRAAPCLLEISKLAQHAYKEGHRVVWDEARISVIESNSSNRKYKESAHMSCLTTQMCEPGVGISPILAPLLAMRLAYSQGRSVWSGRFLTGTFIWAYPRGSIFVPQMALVVDIYIYIYSYEHLQIIPMHSLFIDLICWFCLLH